MLVRRLPAEWEPHKALWLAMPHNKKEWGNEFNSARSAVRTLLSSICLDEGSDNIQLLIQKNDLMHQGKDQALVDLLSNEPKIQTHQLQYGDIWLRDTGPIFIELKLSAQQIERKALSFRFNGWGGKYLFEGDADLAGRIADASHTSYLEYDYILEGGAIDSNGRETLLTTRQCLLNKNRNPTHTETSMQNALKDCFGSTHIIWLNQGLIGDHTDGHVDNVARFVSKSRVVCMQASCPNDINAQVLQEVQETLTKARTAQGEALELVIIPSPSGIHGPDGPMPASYCNFLITNQSVIVPVFDIPEDLEVLSIFRDLFPKRRIVPFQSRTLLTGGGAVHCISQQEPCLHF